VAAKSPGGRISRAEVDRELHELFNAILHALRSGSLASRRDGAFRLASPSTHTVPVLETAGVLELFNVFPDAEAALAAG